MKRKENDKKDTERKKAQPNYKNMFMHLMDETPDIIKKITEEEKNQNEIKLEKRRRKNKISRGKKNHRKSKKNGRNI